MNGHTMPAEFRILQNWRIYYEQPESEQKPEPEPEPEPESEQQPESAE